MPPPPLPGKKKKKGDKKKKKGDQKKKKGDKKKKKKETKKKKERKGKKKGATFEGYEDLTPRWEGGGDPPPNLNIHEINKVAGFSILKSGGEILGNFWEHFQGSK